MTIFYDYFGPFDNHVQTFVPPSSSCTAVKEYLMSNSIKLSGLV